MSRAAEHKEPFKIGCMMDWMTGTQTYDDQLDMTRLAFDDALQRGIIDRPVELIVRDFEGPPYGQVEEAVDVWRELALDKECLAVIGPFISELMPAIRKHIEAAGVPTVSYCGTNQFAGEYCFQIPNGTFIDETGLLAEHLQKRRLAKVGIIREDNVISDEYSSYFRDHCRRRGVKIVSDQPIPPFIEGDGNEITDALQAIKDSGADAFVYFAFGATWHEMVQGYNAFSEKHKWDIPHLTITMWVAMTCPGMNYWPVDYQKECHLVEGWIGIDQIHERNSHFSAILDRFEKLHGRRPFHCYASLGYDIGITLAHALGRARPKTPKAVKDALETVRMLPAATGGPGTVIGFGPYDRRGLKGSHYMLLRTVKNGREMLLEDSMADH